MLDRDQARRVLGSIRVGVGAAAVLAPSPAAAVCGISSSSDARLLTRLFGVRELYLGARGLDAEVTDAELRLQGAVDALDGLLALAATISGATPKRTAVLIGSATLAWLTLGHQARRPRRPELSVVR